MKHGGRAQEITGTIMKIGDEPPKRWASNPYLDVMGQGNRLHWYSFHGRF